MNPVKNIILDYGHGGLNASGHYTTAPAKMHTYPSGEVAYEGVLNREIGLRIETLLKENHPDLNIQTTVAADDPTDVSLNARVKFANSFSAKETIFISVHNNAFNSKARGFEIFTSKGKTSSDDLATKIGERVKPFYEALNLPLRFDYWSDGDLDKEKSLQVTRETHCPAVLLECLFFDNWNDYQRLKSPRWQQDFAQLVYEGIMDYVKERNG